MPIRRKRSGWKWLVILLLLGGGVAAYWMYRNRPKVVVPEYKAAAAAMGDLTQTVTANGQLSAVKNVQVGSQISGIIKEVKVDFNTRVKEGQVIAQIDPSTYERNVEEAEAQVASATAALELTQVNHKRAAELKAGQLISQAVLYKTLSDLHQAEATLKIREALLKRAQVDHERTTIYAPISGIVISRNVEEGQTVAASFSTPTLLVIANDLTKMQIDAMVSEADVGGVQEGQRVEFSVDAFQGRNFEGVVKQVRYAPTTNQNVVTYATIIDVNNADLKLRPGMTANAAIVIAEKKDVLKIPNAALRFRPPEGAIVTGATNASGGMLAGGGGERGGPASAGGNSGGRAEWRRRLESMSPEERQAAMERFRSRGGGSPGGQRRDDAVIPRTVYILMKTNAPSGKMMDVAHAVTIKTGAGDGVSTEVIEGLKEGDLVITSGIIPNQPADQRPPGGSPFTPFGRGPGRR